VSAVFFAFVAIVILTSGIMVVQSRDLVHSVFWLALMSMTVAGAFVLLDAGFVGAVQVLLYTGGVVTLMLFGVMLTVRLLKAQVLHESRNQVRAAIVAVVVFGMLAAAILGSPLPSSPVVATTVEDVGRAFLTDWMLPFEVLSVLLLAAMVGAISLARRNDP